ncbi:MAG: MoxR family ATPase [Candidatus Jordarchaeales archaeon]
MFKADLSFLSESPLSLTQVVSDETLMKFYGKSLLLLGPPGVGKSETVRRVAEKLAERMGLRFVELVDEVEVDGDVFLFYDLRLTEVEPTDLVGFPVVGDCVVYKPLKWAVLFSRHPGVLFLDELTNVNREDVLTAAYRIIHERRVGDVRFHPGVWVIAAGNVPEHSSVARMLPAPLVNRMIVVKFPVPSIDEWARYMDEKYGQEWDRRVLAYLKVFPRDFLHVPGSETLDNFPTPRSWTEVALFLPKVWGDPHAVNVLCRGCLGESVGGKFLAFLKMEVPDIDEILEKPQVFGKLGVEQRHLLCTALADWLKADFNRRAVRALPLLKLMLSESREMFMFLASVMGKRYAEKLYRFLHHEARDLLMPLLEQVAEFADPIL